MRFFGGSGGIVEASSSATGPAFAVNDTHTVPISARDLTWDLSLSGLTTQYKSFYFNLSDGSAGFIQYAYGNLGLLVKVAPLGFSYYSPGQEAIVGSHTLRSSQMRVSKDKYSVDIAQHSLIMDSDHSGWTAIIDDPDLKYDLHFRIEGEAYEVRDFGRVAHTKQLRQRFIPKLSVTGTIQARGTETTVAGHGTYTEAYYTHIKFTDFCNEFTHFRLTNEDASQVLLLMQYIPRGGTSSRPLIAHGSFTKDGKVEAICFENESIATGQSSHEESGYDLPTKLALKWSGATLDGRPFAAHCAVPTGTPSSTTDVLNMFPKFFKDIVAIFAGLPYVFCWRVQETVAVITIDGRETELRGISTTELTKVHKAAH